MYLHLSRKYYVATCPLSVYQKHLKDKKSWERGWVRRFVVWLSPFDWNFHKKDGLFWVLNILKEIKDSINNRRKLSEQDLFVDEQTRMKWKYGCHVWSHISFFTILSMYIYRKTTKVQVKIVLKTSLENIFSTMVLIFIYLPRYFFLILICLLIPVRKNLSIKLRLI